MSNININKILNEEIEKFLNEGYVFEHENFKFKSRIEQPSFYNYEGFSNDYDVDINESDIYINWHMGFKLNEFGVENLIIYVDSVEGTYKVQYLDKQTDEVIQESDKNIGDSNWSFNLDSPIMQMGKALYVNYIDFYFDTLESNVGFNESSNVNVGI